MKKAFYRIFSLVLAIVVIITSFSGCTGGIVEADASEYLTKGEWFNYFVSENELYSDTKSIELDLESDSPYYSAVMCVVDYELCSVEEACKDLDKPVTRDVVAYTCVNYIVEGYRKESTKKFKDSDKITDVSAAGEAIDYGILDSVSKNKFKPDEYVTSEKCVSAVENMQNYEANFTFSEDESYTEIEYQDNVKLIDAEIEKVVDYIPAEDAKKTTEVSTSKTLNPEVSYIGNASSEASNLIDTKHSAGDTVIVLVPNGYYKKHVSDFDIGNIIKFKNFEISGMGNEGVLEVDYMEITEVEKIIDGNEKGNYLVSGVLPSDDKIIKKIRKGQKDTSSSGVKISASEEAKQNNISVKVEDGTIKFSYKKDISIKGDKKTSPVFSGTISSDFSIGNFSFTTTGLDTIFSDVVKGKGVNASVKINYEKNMSVKTETDKMRYVPYNNGNGKFPSNFSRSRFTTGSGAKRIKIAKISIPMKSCPALSISFGLYLRIEADGSLQIVIDETDTRGLAIKKGKIEPIKESKKETKIEIKASLYTGLEFEIALSITGTRTPIANFDAGFGIQYDITATLYHVDIEGKVKVNDKGKKDELKQASVSAENCDIVVADDSSHSTVYCIDIQKQIKGYMRGLSKEECYLGKLISIFDRKYTEIRTKDWVVSSSSSHFEDGAFIDKCMRESTLDEDVEHKIELKASNIDISTYDVTAVPNVCLIDKLYVTKLPYSSEDKAMKNIKNLIVESSDEKVCKVQYFASGHYVLIDTYNAGECVVTISTKDRKYSAKCAVYVSKNDVKNTSINKPIDVVTQYYNI